MIRLKIGDKFKQNWKDGSVQFEIIELDIILDTGTIRCTNKYGASWVETWNDMHTIVWAIELGDYIML